MALTQASATNLKRSLEKYFYDTIYTIEGLNINWEGVPFDDTAVSEWVQPRILDISSVYARQASSSKYGEISDVLFQVNIFVKKSGVTVSDRHYVIRDTIANYFGIGQSINLKHYIGDSSQLDIIKVRDIVNDSPMPEAQTLYQYIIAFELSYTRETNKP